MKGLIAVGLVLGLAGCATYSSIKDRAPLH